ncbi:MAG: PD40 domain-containing protein [Chloroflexi bacterium]|nr:PD40 domain-containing protein [Chloroflexota bacterium]
MYTYELATGAIWEIDTGFATDCNNDHVLSPDSSQLAVSHHTNEDAASRIYILPRAGGEPVLVTEKGPSYLHGWSPDGGRLAYCAERGGQYDISGVLAQTPKQEIRHWHRSPEPSMGLLEQIVVLLVETFRPYSGVIRIHPSK